VSSSRAIDILAVGMITPIGTSAHETARSARAGVARLAESSVYNRRFEPMTLALVPEDALHPPGAELDEVSGLTSRQVRMLRLAHAALAEAAKTAEDIANTPVLVGLPEALPGRADPAGHGFLKLLRAQSGIAFALDGSKVYASGRAAAFEALEAGLELLASGQARQVLIGGVDSYLDLHLLGTLDGESRVLAHGVMDGFAPGEGAAFLLLGRAEGGVQPLARVLSAARGSEPGHRYSEQPYRGDGLAATVEKALSDAGPGLPLVPMVYAGLNGEHLGAKEWGVAYARNQAHFTQDLRVEHPVDCLGDAGAALGGILLGLAALDLHRGHSGGPVMVWSSSDREPRGAAILARVGEPTGGA
jgi:3-oxoacyl-[acyl-carrier-protein] synthase-1